MAGDKVVSGKDMWLIDQAREEADEGNAMEVEVSVAQRAGHQEALDYAGSIMDIGYAAEELQRLKIKLRPDSDLTTMTPDLDLETIGRQYGHGKEGIEKFERNYGRPVHLLTHGLQDEIEGFEKDFEKLKRSLETK